MQDLRSRLTDEEIQEMALSMAQNIFVGKVAIPYRHLLSVEDEEQDWKLFVLSKLHSYDQGKGSLVAWLQPVFLTWWTRSAKQRMRRQEHERLVAMDPGSVAGYRDANRGDHETAAKRADIIAASREADPTNELSEKAQEILGILPERVRQTAAYHFGMGTAQKDTANLIGISERSVQRQLAEARRVWGEHYGVDMSAKIPPRHTETHCNRGHAWSDDNQPRWDRRSDGSLGRKCRTCEVERKRAREAAA